jgi:alginate O-acetyltransferase complex protein AlgI
LWAGKLLHPVDAWTGTLAFSGQIFFDFAVYSTCAIGVALMVTMLWLRQGGEKTLELATIVQVLVVVTAMFLCHWVMRERSMKEVAAKTSPWILGLAWG